MENEKIISEKKVFLLHFKDDQLKNKEEAQK
jgi:hypothetical protein